MFCKVSGVRPMVVGAIAVLILLHFQTTSAQTQPPATTPAPSVSPTTATTQPGAAPASGPAATTPPGPTTTTTTTTTATPPAATPTPKQIKVLKVTGNLALYNTVSVEVENLSEYLNQPPGKDPKKFILYLDWRPLKGVNPRLADGANILLFDIKRTADSREQWDALLGRPFWAEKGWTYNVPVSIGYENENPIATNVDSDQKYPLVVVNQIGFWIFLVAFVLSVYLFWWLAKNTGIIRDPCLALKDPKQRPYSLGRAQMAFWLFVVATSYVLIWLITSNPDSLTEQALGLIGISTATALGAAVVGASKSNSDSARKALEDRRTALQNRLKELEGPISSPPLFSSSPADPVGLSKEEIQKELSQLNQQLAPQTSVSFLDDILSDDEGISLHRFQIAIWTVVLGIVFVASVYNSLAMPQFSGTLLALMGISGGTYIGFKFPEKQGTPPAQTPAPPPSA